MKSETIYIGNVPVGDGYPTVFMAEVGTFFNQDIELAENFLEVAVDAGADLFKTEILHSADVCLKNSGLVHRYNYAEGVAEEDYRALVERKVLPFSEYSRLFKACRHYEIPFVASVYDIEGIDFLVEEGGAAIKISRDNVNNIPLVEYAAKTGLPVIMDNGGLYFDEVAKAVRLIREYSSAGVIINHHPAANPAPPEAHNMRVMQTYKEALGVPVGLACHYRGDEILYLAVGMGCNLIEKGIVDDPDKMEQDIVSALSINELPDVIKKVKHCWKAMGEKFPVVKKPRDESTWKGLVAKKNIEPGEQVSIDNVSFAWPPVGISVSEWENVKGRVIIKKLKKGEPIDWNSVGMDISEGFSFEDY